MAKTIKFNLICDGKSVRTLEDLRNNFSIEDILEYYNNKLLHRWLTVRGYEEELKKVQAITETENIKLVKELISAFQIGTDLTIVEENTYILQYRQEREFLLEEYKKMNYKTQSILDDYHAGYRQLIETILENNEDIGKIKAVIREIDENYSSLYELDFRKLFYLFLEKAVMAIFVMLMNENMRNKYLPIITMDESKKMISDMDLPENTDKKRMYTEICSMVEDNSNPARIQLQLPQLLGENLKKFAGITDGYWKDVETADKKFMILRMEPGNYIRATGKSGGDMDSKNINGKFIIIDGIDYKSNNSDHKLLYMEV